MPKEPVNHKHNVEAVLFSTGRKMSVEEIAKLCRIMRDDALAALKELQADYAAKNSSLMVVDEGDLWKLTVREKHLPVIKKIVSETELPKSVVETLAVIAWKAPVLQSDIIKVRTNKAYDHLKELEQSGYITRQKKGRTNLIKLTQKFFQYFDLPPEKLQQMFKNITEMEQAILKKEEQLEQAKQEHKAKEEELKQQQELAHKMAETQIIDDVEIDMIDKQGGKQRLEIYGEQKEAGEVVNMLGKLEVVDEQAEEEGRQEEELKEQQEHEDMPIDAAVKKEEPEEQKESEESHSEEKPKPQEFVPEMERERKISTDKDPAMEALMKKIDKRAAELLQPKTEFEDELESYGSTEPGSVPTAE